jgi:hypothetical protein
MTITKGIYFLMMSTRLFHSALFSRLILFMAVCRFAPEPEERG